MVRVFLGIVVGAGVSLVAVLSWGFPAQPAGAYGGCAPRGYCDEWRTDCWRLDDCYEPEYCGFRTGCYYGPADPPPRHRWRPRESWPPDERAADLATPKPPLPMRRPPAKEREDDAAARDAADSGGTTAREPEDARGTRPSAEMTQRQKWAAEGKIPDRYKKMENTVGLTLTAIEAGAPLYEKHCRACHGASGEGDGPRAQAAGTAMPSLPHTLKQDYSTDTYLIWTIQDGGQPFGTEKPAFKHDLNEDEAWQIIAYMRAGFPARDPEQPLRQTMQTQTGNTPAPRR